MLKKGKLLNKLTKYFILSTAIPFISIIMIAAGVMQHRSSMRVITLMNGYINSTAENISMYLNNLEQIIILPYFSDQVMQMLNRFSKQENISFVDQTRFGNAFGNLISSIRYVSNDFYSALIVCDNGTIYSNSNINLSSPINDYDWTEEKWYKDAIEADGSIVFVPPHVAPYYSPADDKVRISLVCTLRNLVTKMPYAVIKIDILPSSFSAFFENLRFDIPYIAYIEDSDGNLIFSMASDDFMNDKLRTEEDNGQLKIAEHDPGLLEHLSERIPKTPYTLNILLDKATMTRQTVSIYVIGIIAYIVAFLIALFLNRQFTRRISEPIAAMQEVLSEIEKGNFNAVYHSRTGWELEELGESLNHAAEDLRKLIEKNYIAKLAQEKAENRALISQLQPHFLFNTLNSLIALLYDKKYPELEEGLYSLSELLRYVLRKDNLVTLSEEMNFIKSYLLLQKIRFGERLEYVVEEGEMTGSLNIPRLLIQPFAENAVIHGIEPSGKTCTIKITSNLRNGILNITISDNGAGFDMTATDYHSSIGISNSLERIRIMDSEADVKITSSTGCGCTVEINIHENSDS